MPSELTDELRAALERVPDEWGYVDFPTAEARWYAVKMKELGLIERAYEAGHSWETRRTPAGRAALGSGG